MVHQAGMLESLAALLEYPNNKYRQRAEVYCEALEKQLTDEDGARGLVAGFRAGVGQKSQEELEELFTRTFDLNPACTLDIGWHLYAENYDRGTFLVEIRKALRQYGIPETEELPDHLPGILKLLAVMEEEAGSKLTANSVLPALKKLLAGFEDKENPYCLILQATEHMLQSRYHHRMGVPAHD